VGEAEKPFSHHLPQHYSRTYFNAEHTVGSKCWSEPPDTLYRKSSIHPDVTVCFPDVSREIYTPLETGRPLSSRLSHVTLCVPEVIEPVVSLRMRWPVMEYTASSAREDIGSVKVIEVEVLKGLGWPESAKVAGASSTTIFGPELKENLQRKASVPSSNVWSNAPSVMGSRDSVHKFL